jgi:hypothetical protein
MKSDGQDLNSPVFKNRNSLLMSGLVTCHDQSSAMVPTEILDQILGHLQSDEDYATLETCSVVFPQLVDRHLYSQIAFYSPSKNLPMDTTIDDRGAYAVDPTEFSLILNNHPHVANYVRIIHIIVLCQLESFAQVFPAIASILPLLPQIESFAFSASPGLYWPYLDSRFCTAVQNSIRMSSIKDVAISHIQGFPLNALDDCKNLRSLVLYGLAESLRAEDVPTSPYPRLRSLHVDTSYHSECMLTRIVSGMKLQTLSVHIPSFYGDFPKFQTLIKACSATLVNLEFKYRFACEL